MALKRYDVTVNGMRTVLQLDEAGAKARGLTDANLVKSKSRTPANKGRAAANKGGTGANKGGAKPADNPPAGDGGNPPAGDDGGDDNPPAGDGGGDK